MRRKTLRGVLGVTLVIGALMMQIGPAGADAGDTATAVVTGETNTGAGAPPIDFVQNPAARSGAFTGVVMTGVFTAATGGGPVPAAVYAGTVCTPAITFTTTETLLAGTGTINPGLFNSACPPPAAAGVGTLNGSLTGGGFVRLGTVAVAGFGLNYTVSTPVVNPTGASGSVLAFAVVSAVPGACLSQPSNLGCAEIAGVVATV